MGLLGLVKYCIPYWKEHSKRVAVKETKRDTDLQRANDRLIAMLEGGMKRLEDRLDANEARYEEEARALRVAHKEQIEKIEQQHAREIARRDAQHRECEEKLRELELRQARTERIMRAGSPSQGRGGDFGTDT